VLGGSIARQIAKLANRNIPYHECHAQFMNVGWLGGRKIKCTLIQEFELIREFAFFWEFCEIHKNT